MPNTIKDTAISQLKEMQGEITAIRYYNKKLAEIKKNIENGVPAPTQSNLELINRLKKEKADAVRSAKEPAQTAHPLDILLFIPFALFSLILMIILYPAGKADLLGGVFNWIFQIYFVVFPTFAVTRQIVPKITAIANNMSRGFKITLLAIFGVSVVFVLINVFFRPIFMLCIVPLIFGVIALILKDKENARLDEAKHKASVRKIIASYDKQIHDAELADAEESANYDAIVENKKKELGAKYAEVIKECKTALAKHKAKFKEVKVIPDSLMQNDMGVVDKLIAILQQGKADSLDEAIEVYQNERIVPDANQFGEIYVYVGIRRKDGWGSVRNLVYLDGEKHCSAETPYSVIKVPGGNHTLSAKVQLNYNGAAHYPESEVVNLSLEGGEKKYVMFYVKGTPDVKVKICESADQFGNDD